MRSSHHTSVACILLKLSLSQSKTQSFAGGLPESFAYLLQEVAFEFVAILLNLKEVVFKLVATRPDLQEVVLEFVAPRPDLQEVVLEFVAPLPDLAEADGDVKAIEDGEGHGDV